MERSLRLHDEILLEAPIEATDKVALILKETMEEAGRSFLKIASVEDDVVIVGSWAEKWHLLWEGDPGIDMRLGYCLAGWR